MRRIAIALMLAFGMCGVLACVLGQQATRTGQNLYVTQEAHDDVQDLRLENLEKNQLMMQGLLADTHDKVLWLLAGVAVLGGIPTWLQIVQLRKMK